MNVPIAITNYRATEFTANSDQIRIVAASMGNDRRTIDIDKGDKGDEACAIAARKLDKDLVAHATVAEAARKLFRVKAPGGSLGRCSWRRREF